MKSMYPYMPENLGFLLLRATSDKNRIISPHEVAVLYLLATLQIHLQI